MSDPAPDGVVALRDAVRRGDLGAVEVTRSTLARIGRLDPQLGCYLHVDAPGALAQAARVDRARASGEALGELAGVPIALKDNLCTRGIPTTCASKMLRGYVPPYDAHVVERLRAAGAVLVAKANMDELAMGSSTEASAFQVTRNPWDRLRTPGGSSGGSAAAAAAGLAACALGSDTGGSVRQPASFCGVTAIKPTYGRVSRYGLVAFASSLDQVGPIARSPRDAACVLSVIAGRDARDATSAAAPVEDYLEACGRDIRGTRVGVVRGPLWEGAQAPVCDAVAEAVDELRRLGCEPVEVTLPHARHGLSAYYLVAAAEASSNLARFDGVRYGLRVDADDFRSMLGATRAQGFGPEVRRRILLGTYALSSGYYEDFYLKAQRVRTLLCRDFERAFEACDVLVTPTSPTPAFPLGERVDDPLAMYLADVFTLPASLAGLPALSLPCGFSPEGLPIGLQLTGRAFDEARLFALAHAYHEVTPWAARRPALEAS